MKTIIAILLVVCINFSVYAQKDNPKIMNDSLKFALTYEALSDKELDLKIGELISSAGKKQKNAFLAGVIGAGASVLLAVVTYDKKNKTINGISLVPAVVGGIASVVMMLTGFNDLDNAGQLMRYKALRDKK